jgi:hypothetical protein
MGEKQAMHVQEELLSDSFSPTNVISFRVNSKFTITPT